MSERSVQVSTQIGENICAKARQMLKGTPVEDRKTDLLERVKPPRTEDAPMPAPAPDPASRVRGILATPGESCEWHAMQVAARAAREAGEQVIRERTELTQAERFAIALQAAVEVLEGIGLKLAEGEARTE